MLFAPVIAVISAARAVTICAIEMLRAGSHQANITIAEQRTPPQRATTYRFMGMLPQTRESPTGGLG
jgi:hypothetical protein